MDYIDITPTWVAVLPILLEALENGTPFAKKTAREELLRLASIADALNAHIKELKC